MSNVQKQPTRLVLLGCVVATVLASLTQTAFAYQDQVKQPSEALKDNKPTQSAFTYQGQLKEGSVPANGMYTFRFTLYTAQTGGHELGVVMKDDVVVTNGSFTVQLDFRSDGFRSNESWLELGARPADSADPYTLLSPRQRLTPMRYAIPTQAEPWSVIGAPLSFPRGADKDPLPVNKIAGQSVSSKKIADGQVVKSINFVKDPAGPATESSATLKPSGSTLTLAPQDTSTWTKAGPTVRLSTSTDNVGIGTTRPRAKLDVAGTIHASEAVTVGNSVGLLSSANLNLIEVDNSRPLAIGFSNPMAVNPNPATFENIKVGIGTTNPAYQLTVFRAATPGPVMGIASSTAGGRIAIATCSACYSATANPDDFVLGNDGGARDLVLTSRSDNPNGGAIRFATGTISGADDTEKMRITKAGNVGIGTASPTNTLDVNGPARIRVLTPSPLLNDLVVADANGVLFKRPASTLGGGGSFWSLNGNAATPGNFLGTTVNVPLEIRVNNSRALLIEHTLPGPNIIGGSPANSVTAGAGGATIAGGGFASPGNGNTVTASFGTVGGGRKNLAGNLGTVGGGFGNTASGPHSTVSGGDQNLASGSIATVPGGQANTAAGRVSFAAGNQAQANHNGAFVWSDIGPPFASSNANEFNVRATGGTRIFSNVSLTNGCLLPANGTSWNCSSDREIKENFTPVDGRMILNKLDLISISRWNLKGQDPTTRHLGPVAQDFYAAFGLGEDDKHISTIDLDGVALVSIQTLYRMSLEKDKKIEELHQRLEKLEKLLGTLMKQ